LSGIFGEGFWPYIVETYVGTIALVIVMGGYDLVTRRRLHPVYVAAALWIFANECLAAWLYYQPWWAALTTRLLGH
ncbi:MAG: hypothetical protein ACXU8U_08075, partial [Asticcacaulis sp.]